MTPIRTARLLEETRRGVVLDCGRGLTCRIGLLGPGLVRVTFLQDGAPRLPRTWSVPAHGAADVPWEGRDRLDDSSWPVPEFELLPDAAGPTLRTGALTLEIALAPFRLTWRLPDGRIFAQDRASDAYQFGRESQALRHAQSRHQADRYYGLGDKTGPLDLAGRRLRCAMLDSLGYDPARGDPLYKHWPFLIVQDGATGAAYGLHYDNYAAATFDLGCEHDNYYGPYRCYEAAGGDLDYTLMLGPTLAEVTPHFLAHTGMPALPPRWTLGYAQTAMALADAPDAQHQFDAFLDRAQAEQIPISAFHLGSGYGSIGPRRYVFTWNRAKVPDPPGLMRRFHEAGLRVVANIKPCLLDDHPGYAAAAASGAFVRDGDTGAPLLSQFWDGEGAHLDFTNPAAITWWQQGLAEQVLEPGIDAGWNDNNEYSLPDETAECANFGDPTPLALLRGVEPLLMTRATLERQRQAKPEERSFTVTRAGIPGVQRYAQSWTGDNTTSWETLRWNLRTGLQMSLSGLHNTGHDLGGFAGPVPDAELLTRWVQSGVVHPRFLMNSWKPGGLYNSPWLHPAALPAIRAAIRLRYRLVPLLYSLMHQSAATGAPVLRPTFLEFGDDPQAYADCDELLLGPSLLAAPVVTPGQRRRDCYLPRGPEAWFDFHGGTQLAAGAQATLEAPLDRLPLAVAAGAILPMTAEPQDFSRLHDEPSRCLRLFPGPERGESQFVLVEDDGISAAGEATRITCTLTWTPRDIRFEARPAGGYDLPYDHVTVALPTGESRAVTLAGDGPALIRGTYVPSS